MMPALARLALALLAVGCGASPVPDTGTALDVGAIDASGDVGRVATPSADAPIDAPPPRPLRLYTAQGDGQVVAFAIDAAGELTEVGRVALSGGPSFLDVDAAGRHAVVALEGSSEVVLLALEAGNGIPSVLGSRRSSEGGGPAHVAFDRTGAFALVANYGGGTVASLPVSAGGLEPSGSSRAPGARAHQIVPSRAGGWVLVPCLGDDLVAALALDASGTLTDGPVYRTDTGQGPRHLAFGAGVVYLANELASTVETLSFSEATGALARTQRLSTLPASFGGINSVAEIAVHPAGSTVYVSNRGHDSIAVFAVEADGTLRFVEHAMLEARRPRSFGLDPSGTWLFAGAQGDDLIVRFRVEPDGTLTRDGTIPTSGAPTFVGVFAIE
jgi:6-phosphogluconolactonase